MIQSLGQCVGFVSVVYSTSDYCVPDVAEYSEYFFCMFVSKNRQNLKQGHGIYGTASKSSIR